MVEDDALPDDPGTLKAMLLAERARAERLEQIIKELRRHRFGRRAETLPEDQLQLGLEDVEQAAAASEAEDEATNATERTHRAARHQIPKRHGSHQKCRLTTPPDRPRHPIWTIVSREPRIIGCGAALCESCS